MDAEPVVHSYFLDRNSNSRLRSDDAKEDCSTYVKVMHDMIR